MGIGRNRSLGFVGMIFPMWLVFSASLSSGADDASEKAVRMAPDPTWMLVHVEPKALLPWLDVFTKELKKDPKEFGGVVEAVEAWRPLLPKVQSIDLYDRMNQPLAASWVVARTELSPNEVWRAWDKAFPLKYIKLPERKLLEGPNGRAFVGDKTLTLDDVSEDFAWDFMFIVGKKANDFDDDVLVVAPAASVEEMKTLKTGCDKLMSKLIENVDRAAPMWGAKNLDVALVPREGEPLGLTFSFYPDDRASKVIFVYKDADEAKRAAAKMIGTDHPFNGLVKCTAEGANVVVSFKLDDKFAPALAAAVLHDRKAQRRATSEANLKAIHAAVASYQAKQSSPPSGLKAVVDAGLIDGEMTVVPGAYRLADIDEKGMFTEPVDYVYIVLPKDADAKMVRAYERIKFNKNEGGHVLFADGRVVWMKAGELQAAVKETQDALKNKN